MDSTDQLLANQIGRMRNLEYLSLTCRAKKQSPDISPLVSLPRLYKLSLWSIWVDEKLVHTLRLLEPLRILHIHETFECRTA